MRILTVAIVAGIGTLSVAGCNLNKMLSTSTQASSAVPPALSPIPTEEPTQVPSSTQPLEAAAVTPLPISPATTQTFDRIILSLAQAGHEHLYAYHPMLQPFTQLTSGDWDDRDPAVNPEGKKIAFTSNRGGSWDLYVLDLITQQTIQLTQTLNYDGSPSWSPDGQWIAYETYDGTYFDIVVMPANDPTLPSIQLTEDAGNNFSPAWSPAGREVAFVTDRTGTNEIWTANLDKADDRYAQIAASSQASYTSPIWSPDGAMLAWTKNMDGESTVETAQKVDSVRIIRSFGEGSDPAWSPDGTTLLVQIKQPNATYLAGYTVSDGLLVIPAKLIPSPIKGIDWHLVDVNALQQNVNAIQSGGTAASELWQPVITGSVGMNNRKSLVEIPGLIATYPYLQDGVDESFAAMRAAAGQKLGWDFLSKLDDAVLPISAPPQPGISQNWLYTGRAINVDSSPLEAGWMSVTREDFNGKVYWRVWVRCLKQDGSCGEPQNLPAWDFSARYEGEEEAYENGGKLGGIPGGYWLDFTDLALTYGWERCASLSNWRAYFQATLFNQFVLFQGINWGDAMLELYPADVLQGADGSIPLPIEK